MLSVDSSTEERHEFFEHAYLVFKAVLSVAGLTHSILDSAPCSSASLFWRKVYANMNCMHGHRLQKSLQPLAHAGCLQNEGWHTLYVPLQPSAARDREMLHILADGAFVGAFFSQTARRAWNLFVLCSGLQNGGGRQRRTKKCTLPSGLRAFQGSVSGGSGVECLFGRQFSIPLVGTHTRRALPAKFVECWYVWIGVGKMDRTATPVALGEVAVPASTRRFVCPLRCVVRLGTEIA